MSRHGSLHRLRDRAPVYRRGAMYSTARDALPSGMSASPSAQRQPDRAVQHPDQRSVADLLSVRGWSGDRCGDCGLPLNDMKRLPNIHPGEVLLEEFLRPMALSQNAIASDIGVPPRRINEIVLGKRSITADTAIRLARRFKTSEQFWMSLQAEYDLEEARKALRVAA